MKRNPSYYQNFCHAVQNNDLVILFGTGISSTLTGQAYSWWKWIVDGIEGLADKSSAQLLREKLEADSSTANMVSVVGKVMEAAKSDGSYTSWMHNSFEVNPIQNNAVASLLKKLVLSQVVFATTNYDNLLESATGLSSLSYEDPNIAFQMLDKHLSTHVLHIHGIYDSIRGIDNIVADEKQYDEVMANQGAQFIQNILGTRTVIFVGCGKTTEDPNISRFIEFAKKHLKMDSEYYFLCKEPVDGLPEQIVQIQYGDDYDDLPAFLEDVALLRLKKKIHDNPIIGRTAYEDSVNTDDGLLKYHYSKRAIPFCGREKELVSLKEFIEAGGAFSWWTVTGQAGSGKSRLALELIFNLPTSWFGFFLSDSFHQRDIDSFIPFCNTLVIIDYVAGRERFVAGSISSLRKLFAKTNYSIRVLLIERENNKASGSWYSKLMQRMSRSDVDIIRASEHSDSFLNLEDMKREEVEAFICEVCKSKGVDTEYMSELYEAYNKKYERLRFRPLYLQLFVEAWADNGCIIPQYDLYTQLLEYLLTREQQRWLDTIGGDQRVCNAIIRLMIRANISGRIRLSEIPELYKPDWDIINDFIERTSFAGRQRKEWQDNLINSFCQNIDDEHAIIAPQFPDIIKEYMFYYYGDEEFLPDMMKEIWQHAAAAFNVFIMRCMMDFPDQAFYRESLKAYKASTTDIEVLVGRLGMLQGRLIQKGEDPKVYWDVIENEYQFWSSVEIPDIDTEERDTIASVKVAGLYKVAQHVGAWSLYDLDEMESVIDEMLSIKGGPAVEFLKKHFLQDHIKALSIKGFANEVQKDRDKLDALLSENGDAYDSMLMMDSYNNKMMESIMMGNMSSAEKILLEMAEKCNYEDLESVRILAHSCRNIDNLAMLTRQYKTLGVGFPISVKCETLYPEDWMIKARRIDCQISLLQKQCLENEITKEELQGKITEAEKELSEMQFNGTESDDALEATWGALKMLKLNIASAEEVNSIISEADAILKDHPRLSSVAAAGIQAVTALHTDHYHDRVSHEEVEKLYTYVVNNPDSESVRGAFFNMLEASVDAGHMTDFFNPDIIREAISDARYNPMSGSGITAIDSIFDDYSVEQPYVRKRPKVGRNDPCPCGSGKKFKKCCMGKGIYD